MSGVSDESPKEAQQLLHIAHAPQDEAWVHGVLVPALGLTEDQYWTRAERDLDQPELAELERAVQTCRYTLLVASSAARVDQWTQFAGLLAEHLGIEEGKSRLLLVARDFNPESEEARELLPLRQRCLICLDCSDPRQRSASLKRLAAHLALALAEGPPPEVPCPYPGMRPYSSEDAAHFHGRDAEIDELLGLLRAGEREIYVIGPSGSGKSSLVAAGLLPRLARGASGLGAFLARTMRPGDRPTARLARVLEAPEGELAAPASAIEALLARHAPGAPLLLVIDQLEELFTLSDAGERASFLVALRALRAEPRCVLVLTLRADFYGIFMESPIWKDLRGRIARVEVGRLGDEELRIAITQPARDVGVYLEPELVERLLADASSEPGVLPLLQETLVQLWGRRELRLLALADYEALGDGGRSGLAVALARRADATLAALSSAQQKIARRIFLRLTSFDEGRSSTRRQQSRSKLRVAGEDAADFNAVLRRLIDDRLLTASDHDDHGDARIDLAHEVMLTAWPTLVGWIQRHRADEQHRRRLEASAALWVERQRGTGGLLNPTELVEAEVWQKSDPAREVGQSAILAELIATSRAVHDRQTKQRRYLLWGGLAALIVLAGVIKLGREYLRYQDSELEESLAAAKADCEQARRHWMDTERARLEREYMQELAERWKIQKTAPAPTPRATTGPSEGAAPSDHRGTFGPSRSAPTVPRPPP